VTWQFWASNHCHASEITSKLLIPHKHRWWFEYFNAPLTAIRARTLTFTNWTKAHGMKILTLFLYQSIALKLCKWKYETNRLRWNHTTQNRYHFAMTWRANPTNQQTTLIYKIWLKASSASLRACRSHQPLTIDVKSLARQHFWLFAKYCLHLTSLSTSVLYRLVIYARNISSDMGTTCPYFELRTDTIIIWLKEWSNPNVILAIEEEGNIQNTSEVSVRSV